MGVPSQETGGYLLAGAQNADFTVEIPFTIK